MNTTRFKSYRITEGKSGIIGSYKRLLFLIPCLLISSIALGQDRGMMGGSVSGRVLDSALQTPIEYATIILFGHRDSTQVTGISTDEKGFFNLAKIRPGRYYLRISFLGYNLETIDEITISRDSREVVLGEIRLVQSSIRLKGLKVTAEKPAIEFKIDKKVINVEKYLTATTGTAVDVLENVPSVSVDLEGNVELRGSSSFTVLIDGRPTILEPNDALQQIPASTIDNIEIITNPAARYDPDGTSGIINIIMKKNEFSGISGVMNSNGGLDDKYGGDVLFNYRNGLYNAFINIDYNKRMYPGTSNAENRTSQSDTTAYVLSNGQSQWGRSRYGGRGGIDFNLTSKDNLGLGLRYGGRAMERDTRLGHEEWTDPGLQRLIYTSENNSERSGDFYSLNLDYMHQFGKQTHELSAQVIFNHRDMDEDSKNELIDSAGLVSSGQHTTEEGPSDQLRIKLDYIYPVKEKNKIEMGYQSRLGSAEDITRHREYDTLTGVYQFLSQFSHTTKYDRDIHSLYAMYGGEAGRFGYQVGFRGEYTYRNIEIVDENKSYNIDRWDYFPSIHTSYRLNSDQQLMASYSRRIKHARGWYLEPFETWTDAYNVRTGNPDLQPEYIDSYELGYQKSLGRSMFSAEAYYRITHNKVEFVRSVYDVNVTLRSVENVGTDYAFGTELMLNMKLFNIWDVNCMGNLYYYRVEGELYGEDFSEEDFSWSARLNNTVNLSGKTRLQINGRYRSGSVTSQGEREGVFTTNLALKHDFISRILSATLQINDIFRTSKHEFTSTGTDFYNYSFFERKSPTVMLNIRYNFNNFKQERDRERNGEDMGEDDF